MLIPLSHEALHLILRRLSSPGRWIDIAQEFDMRYSYSEGVEDLIFFWDSGLGGQFLVWLGSK